ncbi:hypothetical protein EX30DRAFT_365977 [Ascodesmis nigricans]|uniref:Uncharacterized protein n=1 Tax=Ascodesmis nigricans TaxID=341454 RepID=A0A4S2MSA2_9PEZI|nr:hypothetical protein EX30DRAFT_365977 [Ascodesmis nigricans]
MGPYTPNTGISYTPFTPSPPAHITGKHSTILLHFLILTLPLSIITAILLGLIFHYQITPTPITSSSLLTARTTSDSSVYYVHLNPTFLMKIASLSSTIATFMTTFAVGLAVYPLAAGLLRDTRDIRPERLLTPWQYYWVLNFAENAGWPAVYRWIWGRKEKKEKTGVKVEAPKRAVNVGRVALATLVFGGLVFAADTWLHFVTKPFELVQVTAIPRENAQYGRRMSSNCTDRDNTYNDQWNSECTFSPNIRGGVFIDPITTLEVFNNVSETLSVNTYSGVSPPHAFLGVPNNGAQWKHDFTADTISITAKCSSAMVDCGLSRADLTNGAGVVFNCPKYPAWWGLLVGAPPAFNKQYFTDATGSKNVSGTSATVNNPFYVGFNGLTTRAAGAALKLIQTKDPGVVSQEYGGVAYLHFCEISVYDVTYTAINGSITKFEAIPAKGSVATAITTADRNLNAGDRQLIAAADLGSLVADTAQDMADVFGIEYSRVLLRTVSGALQSAPVQEAHSWESIIVAKVPKAPLYALVVAIGSMIVFGVVLTVVALVAAREKEVEEVRARLSLVGLVAEKLEPERAGMPVESLEKVFDDGESGGVAKRVGIGRKDEVVGGWETKVWSPMK